MYHGGDEVERLDIAMEEAGVLGGNGGYGGEDVLELGGLEGDPQVALNILGVDVVAHLGAAGDLPVDELVAAVHAADHVSQDVC